MRLFFEGRPGVPGELCWGTTEAGGRLGVHNHTQLPHQSKGKFKNVCFFVKPNISNLL